MLSRCGHASAVTIVALVLMVALAPALVPSASVGADVAVTISVTSEGESVAGAFVALIGSGGRYAGVTDELGQVVLSGVPDGTYAVVASASGTTVGEETVTLVGGGQVNVTVERSGTKFRGLGAYGAQVSSIVSDGKSGVFYLTTEAIPSLFRTADYGGSWAPVTLSNDDPDQGLDATVAMRVVTTSGFPGEVAAVANNKEGQMGEEINIWYSRDFGVTWRRLAGSLDSPAHDRRILWGHAGDVSVILVFDTGSTNMWYARMPTDAEPDLEPQLSRVERSFKAAPGDSLAIANGSAAPVLAVNSGTGSVMLYEIRAIPDRTTAPSVEVTGAAPDASPIFVRLGGPASGPELGPGNLAPNTILTYAYDPMALPGGAAIMSSYSEGRWIQTEQTIFKQQSDDTDDPAGAFQGGSCAAFEGAVGSVSPLGSAGTVAMCWVTQEDTTLVVRPVRGINNNTGIAFDAGYDGGTNQVLISGDGSIGAVKSASMDPNLLRPVFPEWPKMADPGTAPDSGGIAIRGVDAADVRDIAVGPTAGDIVAALGGGGRFLASRDGGESWMTLEWQHQDGSASAHGGYAVDWWESATAGTYLILGGGGGAGDMLGVLSAPGSLSAGALLVGLPGSQGSDLGLPLPLESHSITAIVGMPGTDAAYVGITSSTGSGETGGALRRVTLSGVQPPAISDTGLTDIGNSVVALDYCPPGSDERVADKLFAALAPTRPDGHDGGIAVFSDASSSPVFLGIAITGAFNEVRAHCGSGTVYAGRSHSLPPGAAPDWINRNGLVRSQDGGQTFEEVSLAIEEPLAFRLRNVVGIGLNPDDPNEIVVVGAGGDIIASADGGETWVVQNDTRQDTARHFGSPLNDIELPPPPELAEGQVAMAAEESAEALLGSGSGLFSAAVRPVADGGGGDGHWLYVPLVTK
ncbi:MAG: hypothetical protein HPY83_06670 [Anaerolineae bacterium]|nr:hypothetical protein [Anaerolineae bacterium]